MTKRCDADAQATIDLLTPLAGARRIKYGPDDGVLFLLGKIIHDLQTGKIEGRAPRTKNPTKKQRVVKAHLANGARVTIAAEVLDAADDAAK